ncbi:MULTISPECIES: carbohydrate porin [Klebsiella]|jgi:Carbohydrate-selective porin|uniref:carbohydrate porin n=1 Tax=Klebsiella TaxID=570 RepID=UPI00063CA7F4|nr:carbohydrate porin [Klebsiella aerogenes]EIW9477713.1 porin [Klebsiella aerogenes]EIW9497916.1 porin [Klebsiella aerogenes]EKM7512388.1 carbohydrate porin [Klebsiella aerogenes]ELW9549882.1 carbohydrate porin [Klebsiella aerogenes]KLF24234.1 porin [Klebsiella aerogenes]
MNKLIQSGTMLLALLHPFLALANDTFFSPTAKNMTGEWGGVRTDLRHRGYDFTLEYSSMTATNISGGYDRDKTLRYSDQYILGIDMDLEKIFGIHDGEFKASLNDRNGRDLTQDRLQDPRAPVIGSGVQSNYGRGQTWHATQFWFKKTWQDKKWDLKVGLMPPGEDFDNSGCFFQNLSLCGSLAGHGSGVWYNTPIGQWGGRIKYVLSSALYIQAGGFQYNPNYATRHGSFELDGTGHLGYMYIVELGHRPTPGATFLPDTWKIGGWYNTADANDVLDDDNGDPYVLTQQAARRHGGRYGGYLYVSQQLTHSGSQRQNGLNIFGHLAINDKNTATMDYQIQAGIIYKGPFASRPQDFISFGVSKMHANAKVARRAQLQNQMRGIDDYDDPLYVPVRRSEYAAELHYSFHVTPWLTLRPNLQLLAHPGGIEEIKDAWVIGNQVTIKL